MSRQISKPELGALILFKGEGFTFHVISFLLGLVNRKWAARDWKPWHVGFISGKSDMGWLICEALGQGICNNPLSNYDGRDYRIYRWFKTPPSEEKVREYVT